MERTESLVVQVAPDYENDKIKEMENFGWSLDNRQEVNKEGDAYGRPSYLDGTSYLVKQKISYYTELHFSRNLDLDDLEKIKDLEEKYFNLEYPSFPKKYPGPLFVRLFLCMFYWPFYWPFYYFFRYRKEYQKAKKKAKEVNEKREEILYEVNKYL